MDLLKHLKFFVTIAEEGHFGRAADRLRMAQPPLSQGLQRLERELGVTLMTRNSRGVKLTTAGRDLLPQARDLIRAADELHKAARSHSTHRTGLRLGVIPQLSTELVGALAATGRKVLGSGTDKLVEITSAPTTALVEAVSTDQLDIVVVHHPALLDSLHSGPVLRLDTALLIPAQHPAAGTAAASLRALAGLPVAATPRAHNPAAYDLLVDTLEQRGHPARIVSAENDRAALALVAAGQAIMFTADRTLHSPGVVRVRVAGEQIPLRLRLVWNEPPPKKELIDQLLALLTTEANR